MADIFLSYDNEDRETARHLVPMLEEAGWSVWWDRRIPAGKTWRAVLDQALTEMKCMLVLWSARSVVSDWVIEEAEEARSRGMLVPVLIGAVLPPRGFREIQALDFAQWNGERDAPCVRQLFADLEAVIGSATHRPAQARAASASEPGLRAAASEADDAPGTIAGARPRDAPRLRTDSVLAQEEAGSERVTAWSRFAWPAAITVVAIAGAVVVLGLQEHDGRSGADSPGTASPSADIRTSSPTAGGATGAAETAARNGAPPSTPTPQETGAAAAREARPSSPTDAPTRSVASDASPSSPADGAPSRSPATRADEPAAAGTDRAAGSRQPPGTERSAGSVHRAPADRNAGDEEASKRRVARAQQRPARTPSTDAPKADASATPRRSADTIAGRCAELLSRAQVGETLGPAQRAFLQQECRT